MFNDTYYVNMLVRYEIFMTISFTKESSGAAPCTELGRGGRGCADYSLLKKTTKFVNVFNIV